MFQSSPLVELKSISTFPFRMRQKNITAFFFFKKSHSCRLLQIVRLSKLVAKGSSGRHFSEYFQVTLNKVRKDAKVRCGVAELMKQVTVIVATFFSQKDATVNFTPVDPKRVSIYSIDKQCADPEVIKFYQ